MLTKEKINRYSKQMLLPGIGVEGQERIKAASVLVIGAGGLGCPALQYLAAAGVGHLGIMDFDKVDESNLQRQILYSVHDIGKSKAKAAAQKLHFLNPFIQLSTVNCQLSTENALEVISPYDIILDCTDNFSTRYLINDACVLLNKPFIYAGIHKFHAQLAVFNYKKQDGTLSATYRCAFPNTHPAELASDCNDSGVIGTLCGIIGTMQANEAIKIIIGIGEVCADKMLLLNALDNGMQSIKLHRNESLWNAMPRTEAELKQKDYSLACLSAVTEISHA